MYPDAQIALHELCEGMHPSTTITTMTGANPCYEVDQNQFDQKNPHGWKLPDDLERKSRRKTNPYGLRAFMGVNEKKKGFSSPFIKQQIFFIQFLISAR
ncbi:MAG: hypothetical protein UT08_C0017G0005 [Candidatus Woesebacteria bacterium GW2011_GWB1_38_8]|uniref:Uncharacterized protein n=1 Tax=Candidatus Woesebacteria bacterium GW2011_GWB1_38_8 TaxID=1618570 RepID=A0A0G0P5B3_9BACT|nr:MAG: hypothetical protein UT08_C0017G0005 [Candidatus Woesebacteria bacterium GW2011_GWB1_38_8]